MLDEFGREEALDALAHLLMRGMEVLARFFGNFSFKRFVPSRFFLPFVPRFLRNNYKA